MKSSFKGGSCWPFPDRGEPNAHQRQGFAVDELAREVMEFMKKPGASLAEGRR